MSLTRQDIEAVLGPVDEATAAQIAATGASADELLRAWTWLNSDEALIGEGQPLPSGTVAELIDLLRGDEDEEP